MYWKEREREKYSVEKWFIIACISSSQQHLSKHQNVSMIKLERKKTMLQMIKAFWKKFIFVLRHGRYEYSEFIWYVTGSVISK